MTMASAARCVPALALHDARARRASANATRAMVPKTQAFSTGRRASDPEGFLAGDARVGVDASEARSRRASRRTTEAVPSPFPRRARSARHAASRPGRHLRHLRIEANNIPSLRHLDCRVPSVTASASRRAATRDARNARDLAFAASPRRRPGEARAVALAGAPGDPPAAVAGAHGTHNNRTRRANASSAAALAFVSGTTARAVWLFGDFANFFETRAPSRVARGRAAVSFSVSTRTVRRD
jgi:hypothetical protein